MDTTKYVTVRFKGRMYHIPKAAYETDDRNGDRAWYIAKKEPQTETEFVMADDEGCRWCNEKYLGMKYSDDKVN